MEGQKDEISYTVSKWQSWALNLALSDSKAHTGPPGQRDCYGLNFVPHKFISWSPNSHRDYIWSEDVIKVKWGRKGGAPDLIGVLKRGDIRDTIFQNEKN